MNVSMPYELFKNIINNYYKIIIYVILLLDFVGMPFFLKLFEIYLKYKTSFR